MEAPRIDQRWRVPSPVYRRLRVFASDPGTTARFETAVTNETTLLVPWEQLDFGPVGEYVAVIDKDKRGKNVHPPVNLNDPQILAQDGLAPSDGNPQFHHQMVYAVAMRTIRNFERALGRRVHWATAVEGSKTYRARLPVYPHYYTESNAFYEREQGLLFGYFRAGPDSPFPGTIVYSCLSQDVVAHEVTMALLDGMAISFKGQSKDAFALHLAYADLISLLQHFWPSEVFRHQIAEVRGKLENSPHLGALAPQFGMAWQKKEGLRNVFGKFDKEGNWQPRVPDPKAYLDAPEEPHERGAIVASAVFEALKKIYEARTADLRRIASKGTGILPEGALHPDLVNRLAQEASRCAQRVLEMVIRALDYMPPAETTFGDFLRAIITADYDMRPVDDGNYRLAFVDAFRSYGIVPAEVGTLSQDTLLWRPPQDSEGAAAVSEFVRELSGEHTPWNLPRDREQLWTLLESKREALEAHLRDKPVTAIGPIDLTRAFTVESFHPRERSDAQGALAFQWVIKIIQEQPRPKSMSKGKYEAQYDDRPLAGLTLIVDGDSGIVRYQIERQTAAPAKGKPRLPGPVVEATPVPPPTQRQLRVFAFDPSMGRARETIGLNEAMIRVPWERAKDGRDQPEDGPVGEYVEVIDRDPASKCFYSPIDLNSLEVIAQHGLPPSESNPQFHQQMVYAVAMRTIRTFERALGRLALWRAHAVRNEDGSYGDDTYVQRLRIYPHALREANAYYSPDKVALLFGYFSAPAGQGTSARLTVFSCLSHDIIAHEVTHALLDGMHRRFNEASNPDVLAFHEAFADIVALFQHFSLPEVLRNQIATTRGDLAGQSQLGELAQEFGQAIGNRGALRSAIGSIGEDKKWKRNEGHPDDYQRSKEPHERGAVLVAAVFDAFLSIYKGRVADLFRIATEGTGVLPEGSLHPDLVERLTAEASSSARQVLDMCIRALDYCPPVDITFGDYLRALVTADFENDPVDDEGRRVAFIEAFRRRGIVPDNIQAFSVDGLLWRAASGAPDEDADVVVDIVKNWASELTSWGLSKDRAALFDLTRERRIKLHSHLRTRMKKDAVVLAGLDPQLPTFEVHSLRPSIRIDFEGRASFLWVIELTQRIAQYVDGISEGKERPDYYFRGGCTLLVDAETGQVRYSIKKKLSEERKKRQRDYFVDEGSRSLAATYFGPPGSEEREPFAALHRH